MERRLNIRLIASTLALILGVFLVLPAAPAAAQEESTFISDYVGDFERASGKLVSLAEAVPEEKYSWRPAEGVRSVSELFMHVTGVNLLVPAGLGAAPPEGLEIPENPFALLGQMEADITAKDAVIAKLKESIEYAKGAVQEVAAAGLEEQSEMFGFPASKRAYLLIVLTHTHEHLGQAIAYARMNEITPPWSQKSDGDGDG